MSVHQSAPWTGERVRTRPATWLSVAAPLALCALVAVAIQSLWLPLDSDVSWLITVSERVLSGSRLYVDVVEVNPPASVWLYLPFVWLAQASGIRPEAVVVGGFIVAGLASSVSTVRLASRLENAPPPGFTACACGFVTLVLPMALFAQREHAALILALPTLAAIARIAEGKPLGFGTSLASGIAVGAMIAIKPHFALAVVLSAGWAAYRVQSLKPLLPAITAASTVLVLYLAALLLWARAFFAWLPVISHTYLRFHDSWDNVIVNPLALPGLILLLVLLLRPKRIAAMAVTSVLGAAGFAAAAILQTKTYPNYLLPGFALALFAALCVFATTEYKREKPAIGAAVAAICLVQMYCWGIRPDPAIAAAITKVAQPHPKMIALSRELATGHPLTRNIGGSWIGSRAGLFIAGLAHDRGLRDPVAAVGYQHDIHDFAEDVTRNTPDVILVDRTDKDWLMREPEITAAMRGYVPRSRVGDIEIWVRKSRAR